MDPTSGRRNLNRKSGVYTEVRIYTVAKNTNKHGVYLHHLTLCR